MSYDETATEGDEKSSLFSLESSQMLADKEKGFQGPSRNKERGAKQRAEGRGRNQYL